MKPLLLATAGIEAGAGLFLLAWPSVCAWLLLAVPLESVAALAVARVGGMGLLTLGAAAWFASHDCQSCAARGLVSAMVLYNLGAVLILGAAGIGSQTTGIALWPGVLLHAAMGVWCIAHLLSSRSETSGRHSC